MAATAPVWKANGTAASGTGAFTVAWPVGHATGDFAVLLVNSSSEAIATPSGWTLFGTNTSTGTASSADSCMLAMFYRFATSGAEAAVNIADSGDHTLAVITTFTGVSTVNPVEAISAYTSKAVNSTADTFPTVTTLGANRLVCAAISTGQESVKSAPTFAGLTSFTARSAGVTTSGVDGGIALFSGLKAAAGATGTGSVTESITSKAISVTFALTPVDFEKTLSPSGITTAEAFGTDAVSRAGEVSPSSIASAEAFGTAGVGFSYGVTDCIGIASYTGTAAAQTVNVLPARSAATMSITITKDAKSESSYNPWTYIMGNDLSTTFQNLIGRDQTGINSGSSPSAWATTRGVQFATGSTYYNALDRLYKAYTFRAAPGFMAMVEYTGNGAASQTVSHTLGMAPSIIIVSPLAVNNATNWYHSGLGATKHLNNYDRSTIVTSSSALWNSTAPGAASFTVGGSNNASGQLYRCILFGHRHPVNDFVSVGTYTGNGSTSGPSVSCGWRPRIIGVFNAAAAAVNDDTTRMMKFIDADSSASDFSGSEKVDVYGYGGVTAAWAASFPAEATADIVSSSTDGFQLVTTDNGFNRSGETFYYVAFRGLEQVVSPSSITTAEAFGTAVVTIGSSASPQTVSPSGIATAEALGTAALSPGAVSVSPASLATAEALGAVTVSPGAVTVSPSSVASAQAFGTAVVTPGAATVAPSSIASAEALGSATVTPGAVSVSPSAVASAEAFGTAVVAPGVVTVSPAAIATAEAFGTATLLPGSVEVAPASISSAETFGEPDITIGAATVSPESIGSSEAFGEAELVPGPVDVAPSAIASAAAVGTPTVSPGAAQLAPDSIASLEQLGAAVLSSIIALQPSSIAGAEQVGDPTVTPGAVEVGPASIGTAEQLGLLALVPGSVTINAEGIATGEAVSTGAIISFNIDQLVSGAGGILTAAAFGRGLFVKRTPARRATISTAERPALVAARGERGDPDEAGGGRLSTLSDVAERGGEAQVSGERDVAPDAGAARGSVNGSAVRLELVVDTAERPGN